MNFGRIQENFRMKKYFLSAVHRKLAESMSFCVRKDDFPILVRENFKFVLTFRTLKISPH